MGKCTRTALSLAESFGRNTFWRRPIRKQRRRYALHESRRATYEVRSAKIYLRYQIVEQLTIDTSHDHVLPDQLIYRP